MMKRLAAALLLASLVAPAALARTPEESQTLQSLATAFQSTKTMAGEFVQFGPDGSKTEGKFYLAKPGKVLFQYGPPSKLAVIADGKSVLVFDRKMQTYDLWPLSKTPLRFLLDDAMDLARSDKVSEVRVEPDLVEVTIVDDSKFGGGRIALIFDRASSELRQWTVTDDQGLATSVTLYNIETNKQLSSKLFKIDYARAATAGQGRSDR